MSKGTLPISGCIVPMSDLDTYPTHWDKYQRGSMRVVANVAERDAISADRRVEGMQVYVLDVKRLDQLTGGVDNTKWTNIFTLDGDSKVILNTSLNQVKYLIAGKADPNLPNAIALASQPDGYLINSGGDIVTSSGVPSGSVALSFGKVLVGDTNNKAAESKTITMTNLPIGLTDKFAASHVINTRPTDSSLEYPNAQYLTDLSDGIVKLESASGLLKIAVADVDYATKTTLETLAAEAKVSADASASSASDAKSYAGAAAGSALAAGTFKEAAETYAGTAGKAAISANDSFLEATAAAGIATQQASDSSGYADASHDSAVASNNRSLESKQYRDEAQGYATSAQTSLNTLLNTGLNQLPNHGDVNFQGFRAYNLADGNASNDAVTLNQLNAVSGSYVKSVNGTAGRIKSTGGQDPVLDLLPTTITAGTYKSPIVDFDDYGRATAAVETIFTGVSGRTSIGGTAPTVIFDLVNTGIAAGSYTSPNITVDLSGRITAITSKLPILGITSNADIFALTTTIDPQTWDIILKTTGVTAGTYNLMSSTVDSRGRISAASTNTLNGTSGRVSISALPNMVVDLVPVITGATVNSPGVFTYDNYGRITFAESASFSSFCNNTQFATTVVTVSSTFVVANLPSSSTSLTNFTWGGGTAAIVCTATVAAKKTINFNLGVIHDGINSNRTLARITKNGTTIAYIDTWVSPQGGGIVLETETLINPGDSFNVWYANVGTITGSVTYTTRSCNITIT